MVAAVEQTHDNRYTKLLENVRTGEVFARKESVKWICKNCGFIHEGENAPQVCPICSHTRAYFEIKAENY